MRRLESDRSMIKVALIWILYTYIYVIVSRIDDSIYNRVFEYPRERGRKEEDQVQKDSINYFVRSDCFVTFRLFEIV